ncbi:hypothetical protein ANANG_G00149210 [Anguilla anguilla]|uniref:Transmembrane protein n=1 Tax=Anguilla anguilla TaxID=7936 RepID=A0A9D3M6C0_ANGAN|nr:hypothetical protein ANANG_G00149210 [Anguilla anguilla]
MLSVENGLPASPSQSGATPSGHLSAPLPDRGSPPGAGEAAAKTSESPGFTHQSSRGPGSRSAPGDAGADARRASKPQPCHRGGPGQRVESVPTLSAAIERPGNDVTKEEGRTGGEQGCSKTCGKLLLAVALVLFSPVIAVGVCMHDLIVCNDHEELYT